MGCTESKIKGRDLVVARPSKSYYDKKRGNLLGDHCLTSSGPYIPDANLLNEYRANIEAIYEAAKQCGLVQPESHLYQKHYHQIYEYINDSRTQESRSKSRHGKSKHSSHSGYPRPHRRHHRHSEHHHHRRHHHCASSSHHHHHPLYEHPPCNSDDSEQHDNNSFSTSSGDEADKDVSASHTSFPPHRTTKNARLPWRHDTRTPLYEDSINKDTAAHTTHDSAACVHPTVHDTSAAHGEHDHTNCAVTATRTRTATLIQCQPLRDQRLQLPFLSYPFPASHAYLADLILVPGLAWDDLSAYNAAELYNLVQHGLCAHHPSPLPMVARTDSDETNTCTQGHENNEDAGCALATRTCHTQFIRTGEQGTVGDDVRCATSSSSAPHAMRGGGVTTADTSAKAPSQLVSVSPTPPPSSLPAPHQHHLIAMHEIFLPELHTCRRCARLCDTCDDGADDSGVAAESQAMRSSMTAVAGVNRVGATDGGETGHSDEGKAAHTSTNRRTSLRQCSGAHAQDDGLHADLRPWLLAAEVHAEIQAWRQLSAHCPYLLRCIQVEWAMMRKNMKEGITNGSASERMGAGVYREHSVHACAPHNSAYKQSETQEMSIHSESTRTMTTRERAQVCSPHRHPAMDKDDDNHPHRLLSVASRLDAKIEAAAPAYRASSANTVACQPVLRVYVDYAKYGTLRMLQHRVMARRYDRRRLHELTARALMHEVLLALLHLHQREELQYDIHAGRVHLVRPMESVYQTLFPAYINDVPAGPITNIVPYRLRPILLMERRAAATGGGYREGGVELSTPSHPPSSHRTPPPPLLLIHPPPSTGHLQSLPQLQKGSTKVPSSSSSLPAALVAVDEGGAVTATNGHGASHKDSLPASPTTRARRMKKEQRKCAAVATAAARGRQRARIAVEAAGGASAHAGVSATLCADETRRRTRLAESVDASATKATGPDEAHEHRRALAKSRTSGRRTHRHCTHEAEETMLCGEQQRRSCSVSSHNHRRRRRRRRRCRRSSKTEMRTDATAAAAEVDAVAVAEEGPRETHPADASSSSSCCAVPDESADWQSAQAYRYYHAHRHLYGPACNPHINSSHNQTSSTSSNHNNSSNPSSSDYSSNNCNRDSDDSTSLCLPSPKIHCHMSDSDSDDEASASTSMWTSFKEEKYRCTRVSDCVRCTRPHEQWRWRAAQRRRWNREHAWDELGAHVAVCAACASTQVQLHTSNQHNTTKDGSCCRDRSRIYELVDHVDDTTAAAQSGSTRTDADASHTIDDASVSRRVGLHSSLGSDTGASLTRRTQPRDRHAATAANCSLTMAAAGVTRRTGVCTRYLPQGCGTRLDADTHAQGGGGVVMVCADPYITLLPSCIPHSSGMYKSINSNTSHSSDAMQVRANGGHAPLPSHLTGHAESSSFSYSSYPEQGDAARYALLSQMTFLAVPLLLLHYPRDRSVISAAGTADTRTVSYSSLASASSPLLLLPTAAASSANVTAHDAITPTRSASVRVNRGGQNGKGHTVCAVRVSRETAADAMREAGYFKVRQGRRRAVRRANQSYLDEGAVEDAKEDTHNANGRASNRNSSDSHPVLYSSDDAVPAVAVGARDDDNDNDNDNDSNDKVHGSERNTSPVMSGVSAQGATLHSVPQAVVCKDDGTAQNLRRGAVDQVRNAAAHTTCHTTTTAATTTTTDTIKNNSNNSSVAHDVSRGQDDPSHRINTIRNPPHGGSASSTTDATQSRSASSSTRDAPMRFRHAVVKLDHSVGLCRQLLLQAKRMCRTRRAAGTTNTMHTSTHEVCATRNASTCDTRVRGDSATGAESHRCAHARDTRTREGVHVISAEDEEGDDDEEDDEIPLHRFLSVCHAAPEVLQRGEFSKASDVYAFAMTFIELVTEGGALLDGFHAAAQEESAQSIEQHHAEEKESASPTLSSMAMCADSHYSRPAQPDRALADNAVHVDERVNKRRCAEGTDLLRRVRRWYAEAIHDARSSMDDNTNSDNNNTNGSNGRHEECAVEGTGSANGHPVATGGGRMQKHATLSEGDRSIHHCGAYRAPAGGGCASRSTSRGKRGEEEGLTAGSVGDGGRDGLIVVPIPDHLSAECKSMLRSCLQLDASRRPSVVELLQSRYFMFGHWIDHRDMAYADELAEPPWDGEVDYMTMADALGLPTFRELRSLR